DLERGGIKEKSRIRRPSTSRGGKSCIPRASNQSLPNLPTALGARDRTRRDAAPKLGARDRTRRDAAPKLGARDRTRRGAAPKLGARDRFPPAYIKTGGGEA